MFSNNVLSLYFTKCSFVADGRVTVAPPELVPAIPPETGAIVPQGHVLKPARCAEVQRLRPRPCPLHLGHREHVPRRHGARLCRSSAWRGRAAAPRCWGEQGLTLRTLSSWVGTHGCRGRSGPMSCHRSTGKKATSVDSGEAQPQPTLRLNLRRPISFLQTIVTCFTFVTG